MLVLINLVNSLDEGQASTLWDVNWIQTVWHSDGVHGMFLKCQYKRENTSDVIAEAIFRLGLQKMADYFHRLTLFYHFCFLRMM